MPFRPEHGWWRAVWRTALAVGATALLAISTAQARDRTSRPTGTPQAPVRGGDLAPTTAPTASASAPEPETPPSTKPEGTPGSPDDQADGCGSETDCIAIEDVDVCADDQESCPVSDEEEATPADQTE